MDTEQVLDDVREGKPSASGMQRIVLCPGSWQAERGLADEASEAAEAGTRLHLHMEEGTMPDDPVEAEAVEWCRAMEAEMVKRYLGCELDAPGLCVLREKRWWDRERLFSGQADVVYVYMGRALVLDYKFGRAAVPVARDNMQLAALALLAMDNLPDVNEVFCGILQPMASRQEPGVVRYHREMRGQLWGYFAEVLKVAESAHARRVPGEVQCRYCKAKATCAGCMTLMQQANADVTAEWAEWPAEKKAEAVRLAGLAKRWAEAVERKAKADLAAGLEIPGVTLGAGRRSFKVTDAQGAFAVLARELGISGEEFAGCCSVKISALDKVVHARLAEQAPEGQKQLVKASAVWLREQLAGCGAESVSEGALKYE